jgi:AMMECR1 domain-containing protein
MALLIPVLPDGKTALPQHSSCALVPEDVWGACLRFARSLLIRHFSGGNPELCPEPEAWQVAFDKVNITIRTRGRVRGSMSGKGPDLPSAIRSAVEKTLRDTRWGALLEQHEASDCVLELWVQIGSERITERDPREIGRGFVLGVDGVEIRLGEKYAYYKPSVPLTSDFRDHADVLKHLCIKAGVEWDAWQDRAAELRRTKWVHVVESPGGGHQVLRRLRPPQPQPVAMNTVRLAMRSAAERLVRTQGSDGTFLYRYEPIKDRVESASFSSVRHAGCAYSLAWAGAFDGAAEGGDEFSWAATKALQSLLVRARSYSGTPDAIFIPEGNGSQGKLGTTALTLLALQFEPLAGLFADQRGALTNTLVAMQNSAGWFQVSIGHESEEPLSQDYYPGEVLTALGHELLREARPGVARVFERAFPWYLAYFRSNPNTAFVLWQVDAWRLFDTYSNASATSVTPYAEFVFEMVDWLLAYQYTASDTDLPEYVGGFPKPAMPRFSSACYTEAVIRALGLALKYGLTERVERYRAAARAGLSFVLRLQIGPESAFLFPCPEKALGGISANLATFAMRSDFDQHAITAFLAALELSREWGAHGVLDGS